MLFRGIIRALIITVAIVVIADLVIQRATSNSVPRQLMRAIDHAPPTIDVLGVGNSLVASGFDPGPVEQTFLKSGRLCVAMNGGLGATGVIEHLALLRLALRHHTVRTVVYGFFDQQLWSDVVEKNADLVGNRSMLYYQEPQLTLQYARFDTLERFSFQIYRSSALLRERGSIWGRVEKLRRAMGSVGMPSQETNQFGRKADFTYLEAENSQSFVAACDRLIRSGDMISAPFRALLREAEEHGARVVVVEMPVHPHHRQEFYAEPIWDTFRAKTRMAVEGAGASYLNASAWIPADDLFEDRLHLSKEGAKQFSELLAKYLLQQSN